MFFIISFLSPLFIAVFLSPFFIDVFMVCDLIVRVKHSTYITNAHFLITLLKQKVYDIFDSNPRVVVKYSLIHGQNVFWIVI